MELLVLMRAGGTGSKDWGEATGSTQKEGTKEWDALTVESSGTRRESWCSPWRPGTEAASKQGAHSSLRHPGMYLSRKTAINFILIIQAQGRDSYMTCATKIRPPHGLEASPDDEHPRILGGNRCSAGGDPTVQYVEDAPVTWATDLYLR